MPFQENTRRTQEDALAFLFDIMLQINVIALQASKGIKDFDYTMVVIKAILFANFIASTCNSQTIIE
jgi:hypothetical protein